MIGNEQTLWLVRSFKWFLEALRVWNLTSDLIEQWKLEQKKFQTFAFTMKGLVIHRKILTLSIVTLLLLVTSAWCQSQDQDQDSENSQDSVTGSDPNLVNPQKNQGYGRNSQSQLLPPAKTTRSSKPAPPVETSTVAEQSVQAILQFGVLVRNPINGIFKW